MSPLVAAAPGRPLRRARDAQWRAEYRAERNRPRRRERQPFDPADPKAQAGRRARYDLRRGISHFTTLDRVQYCGSPLGSVVGVKYDGQAGAGFSGIQHCGSIHACPVCASKIAAKRALELQQVLEHGERAGLKTAMYTLTVRHSKDQPLQDVWDAVQSGWHAITSGRAWKREKAEHGVHGYVRAVEATVGDNGWHVHIHALVLLSGDAERLGKHVWNRWQYGIQKRGFEAVRDSGGFDVVVAASAVQALGDYLVKLGAGGKDLAGLSREATFGQAKSGRLGGRTPFQVAADAAHVDALVRDGHDVDASVVAEARADVALWREWEISSERRRALTWSKGLREWARLQDEQTDEEVAAEEAAGDEVLRMPRATFLALRRMDQVATVLDLVESSGGSTAAVRSWLDGLGLAWSPPETEGSRT